ncbi:hypothetical protein [Natrinema salinisoli]|uniref:hypothetical protein n=1 Tax=Natrinema salinisoli TaxID=2878535 RepID=UPI001CF020C2|nr:hypothetical protein [Natrinema salinisoli]
MNRTTLIAVALAALIAATGFAAAAPGNAPVSVDANADSPDEQHANEHSPDEQHANEHAADDQQADDDQNRSENGAAAANAADERNGQGPNVDLPEQVPDHVSQIHDRISSFLNDDLDGSLGDAVSDVTPDDDESDEADDTDEGDAEDEQTEEDADDTDGDDTDDEQTTEDADDTDEDDTDDEQTDA